MYHYTILPKSSPSPEDFQALAAAYKSFRLLSLLSSPENFGATHAAEAALPPDTWAARLSNPRATFIVAFPEPDPAPGREWDASLVITEPADARALASLLHAREPFSDFGPVRDFDAAAQTTETVSYVMNGMYVLQEARGKGLGVGLLERAKRYAEAEARARGKRARMFLNVDYDNLAGRRTYEKCGFEVVHRYWFDDYRPGRGERTEAAVMAIELGDDGAESG